MNWTAIESALEQGLNFISELAPAASAAGPLGASIGAVVGKVTRFASDAIAAAEQEADVIGEDNLANLKALQAKIQAANDVLAAQIAAS